MKVVELNDKELTFLADILVAKKHRLIKAFENGVISKEIYTRELDFLNELAYKFIKGKDKN